MFSLKTSPRLLRFGLSTSIFLLLTILTASIASAAVITWEGDESALWSTGGNWAGGVGPGVSDVATFNGTGNTACTIDANINVTGIEIQSGYTNTLTQADGVDVLTRGYTQADGTFAGGNSVFSIPGIYTLSGGIFTSTSGVMDIENTFTHTAGGTFYHNNGTVHGDGNGVTWNFDASEEFYNFTVKKNGAINLSGDTMVVNGTFVFENGTVNNGVIDAKGNVNVEAGADAGGTATLQFTHASADQTFDLSTNGDGSDKVDNPIIINKVAGSVVLGSALTMDAGGQNLTITSGSLFTDGNALTVAGTFSNEDTLQIQGAETLTLTNDTNSGTVEYVGDGGASQTDYTLKDWTYWGLTVNFTDAADTLGDSGTRTIGEDYTLSSGVYTATSGVMSVGGNFARDGGTYTHNSGTVTMTGTGNLTTVHNLYNLIINSSGTVTLGAGTVVLNDVTITAGTLDAGSNQNLTVGQNFANSGTLTPRGGTVIFDTAGKTSVISGNSSFNNFTCTTASKTLTFTAGSTQTVNTITLTGASENLITLQSSAASTWNLAVNGGVGIDYVNVSYSAASGGSAPLAPGDNSTDGGNNTGWSFNEAPTVATVTFAQSTAGDGDVTITFIMDDADDDDTLQAKIEYSVNGGSTWADPTLSTTGSETSATYGDPSIDNAQTYQVGQAGTYITSSSGANTVTIVWEAATDAASSTDISNAQIKVTPYDGTDAGTASASSNAILDIVDPAALASFASANASSASVDLSWTAATDTNFNHYEIWYGSNQTDVQGRTGTATEWDDSDDTDLTTASTATTTVSADPRTKYFKIYAVDDLGNETTLSDVLVSVSRSSSDANIGIPTNISVTDNASGGIILTWTDPDDTASTYVQIMRGISPYPVNASPIVNMPVGTQSYTDTEPTTGQIVVYMLRAYDGSNSGELTAQYSFTVGSTEETETNDSSGGGGSSSSSNDTDDDSDVLEEDLIDSLEDLGFYAPDHWSEGYLKNLDEVEQVLTQAVDMDLFHDILTNIFSSPDDGIDRGIVVQLLLTLSDYDVSSLTTNWLLQGFMDVGAEYVRANYIQFGYEHGLINGYPNGNFYPDKVVNRVEALKMAMYFFGIEVDANLFGNELLAEYNLTSNPFGDVDIEAWYAPYVIHAYDNGVVRGYGNGTFGPDNQVTYAEFVKIATLINDIENAVELASELE